MQENSNRKLVLAPLALAFLGGVFAAPSDKLKESDRQRGIRHLESSRQGVIKAVSGLSPSQWKFKESPEKWSVAEIVEHLALAEDVLFQYASIDMMKQPAGPPDRDPASMDRMVVTVIPDRSRKAKAARNTEPAARWSPEEALAQFRARRDRTIGFLRGAKGLRDHVADSPLGQPMDAYQWLLFLSAHSQRHLLQIREVMALPGFPNS